MRAEFELRLFSPSQPSGDEFRPRSAEARRLIEPCAIARYRPFRSYHLDIVKPPSSPDLIALSAGNRSDRRSPNLPRYTAIWQIYRGISRDLKDSAAATTMYIMEHLVVLDTCRNMAKSKR
ncbi:hypothetical protein PsYK624_127030 [Phanerochaete sordida]|uniref:Uncharacterized protein n=1 Tax=Phanerochaete sordida TaxID=48140 RepID=A0A9P3LIG1_9APHY|nr:hypothetical protein PsYK624_127030 [Phanerochaete sordida]